MSQTGYGRGYYGDDQLAKAPPRRSSGWIKVALVVGVGAVAWIMWRRRVARKAQLGAEFGLGEFQFPPSQVPPLPEWQLVQPQFAQPQFAQPQFAQPQLVPSLQPAAPASSALPQVHHAQIAQQLVQPRGYPSLKEYEDAIVASARQLQDSGTKVVLAPHLAHLTSRLGS
jgi:hypothetical protein